MSFVFWIHAECILFNFQTLMYDIKKNEKSSSTYENLHIFYCITVVQLQHQQCVMFQRSELFRADTTFSRILWPIHKFSNSLWPCYAKWWQRSCFTLAQVMACCLAAPSHYLNQCWLFINGVLWHSPKTNFSGRSQDISLSNESEVYTCKILPHFPGANELN